MLHELFLALTGHPSPLFDEEQSETYDRYVSTSERSLLSGLARLGSLHADIRTRSKNISSTHQSVICRAVSSYVLAEPLSAFQDRIVQVEASILQQDPDFVGAYDIVPLSSIVRAFAGWQRRLEWLQAIVAFIETGESNVGAKQARKQKQTTATATGAGLIDFLRDEAHTGYPEIERTASQLLQVAEAAWLRQLASWLLYGRLPSHGREDFFVQTVTGTDSGGRGGGDDAGGEVRLHDVYLPEFVDADTRHSLFFIGTSLRHIRRGASSLVAENADELENARSVLLVEHSRLLQSLEHPIQTFNLRKVIAAMRSSLSRTALQKLLPLAEILKMLAVLREFMLLERGEFAVTLIKAADDCLSSRRSDMSGLREKTRLGGMMMKEGEVHGVLSRTWASLAALQDINEDMEDDSLDMARRMIKLEIAKVYGKDVDATPTSTTRSITAQQIFGDVLLATPTSLSVTIVPPQDLFLSQEDSEVYSKINSYLIGIRRASIHLSQLWQLSVLRKTHPSPPRTSQQNVPEARRRSNERGLRMRRMWTVISQTYFVFGQLGSYLQGEVVKGCTKTLHDWLVPSSDAVAPKSRPMSGATNSRPTSQRLPLRPSGDKSGAQTAASNGQDAAVEPLTAPAQMMNKDPESVTAAHRLYLQHMVAALLLNDVQFSTRLRNLMTRVDHMVALTTRLAVVLAALQAEEQAATPLASSSHYAKEESDLFKSMESVRKSMESGISDLIKRLNEVDEEVRTGAVADFTINSLGGDRLARSVGGTDFEPWRGASIARLLMRLEPDDAKEQQ